MALILSYTLLMTSRMQSDFGLCGSPAKRIAVQYNSHAVDILVIWRNVKGIWSAFFLLSTFSQETSLGELVQAWKARWGIEVIRRFLK